MSFLSLLMVLSIAVEVKSQWSFAVKQAEDGYFIPYWKQKGVGYSFGEDSFVTTPYGVAVADGIGSSPFVAQHIAKHLTTTFAQWILGCRYPANPSQALVELCKINQNIDELGTIKEVMKQIMVKSVDDANEIINRSELQGKVSIDQSSTFVSAYFSPEDLAQNKKAKLNIFQKGDSLALILRYDAKNRNWKPFAYTSDDQARFNEPYQYSMTELLTPKSFSQDDRNRFFSIEPKLKDVVILGSDGLFDNVPISVITLAFNALVQDFSKNFSLYMAKILKPNTRISLRSLLKAYQRLLGKLDPKTTLETDKEEAGELAEYDADDLAEDWEKRLLIKEQAKEQQNNAQQPSAEKPGAPNQDMTKSVAIASENSNPLNSASSAKRGEELENPDQKMPKESFSDKLVQDEGVVATLRSQDEEVEEKNVNSLSKKLSKSSLQKKQSQQFEIDESDLADEDNSNKSKFLMQRSSRQEEPLKKHFKSQKTEQENLSDEDSFPAPPKLFSNKQKSPLGKKDSLEEESPEKLFSKSRDASDSDDQLGEERSEENSSEDEDDNIGELKQSKKLLSGKAEEDDENFDSKKPKTFGKLIRTKSFSNLRQRSEDESEDDYDNGSDSNSDDDSDSVNLVESVKLNKAKNCKIRNLFFHKKIERDNKDWGFEGLLDPCFEEVLNDLFNFKREDVRRFQKAFNSKLISTAIAEFAKEMTVESDTFASPFWIHWIKNLQETDYKGIEVWSRPSFATKPDDITVVAVLVVKKDPRVESEALMNDSSLSMDGKQAAQEAIGKAVKQEKAIAHRVSFFEKRNKLELEQDLLYLATFSNQKL